MRQALAAARLGVLKDLREDLAQAARARVPLIVLFSRSDCHFCHEVRQSYLYPLSKAAKGAFIVRELVADRSELITGPDGAALATDALLKSLKITFFPTVVFLGSGMRIVAEALVGLDRAGFYSAYLDQRIATAISKA
ncbi:MAG: hypothetical protein Q8R69_24765 [Telluria sp.]|nr:hypothetical protein [Telluria sp.]